MDVELDTLTSQTGSSSTQIEGLTEQLKTCITKVEKLGTENAGLELKLEVANENVKTETEKKSKISTDHELLKRAYKQYDMDLIEFG